MRNQRLTRVRIIQRSTGILLRVMMSDPTTLPESFGSSRRVKRVYTIDACHLSDVIVMHIVHETGSRQGLNG